MVHKAHDFHFFSDSDNFAVLFILFTKCTFFLLKLVHPVLPQSIYDNLHATLNSWRSVFIMKYIDYHDYPTPSIASECDPIPGSKVGTTHSPAGEGLGESQFRRLEKKLSTLPTLWFLSYAFGINSILNTLSGSIF